MFDFIKRIKKHNISIWLDQGRIALAYEQMPSTELQEYIRNHKNELIVFLGERNVFSQNDFNQLDGFTRSPLSFAQQRLLFIERFEGGTNAYHIPELFELNPKVDLRLLEEAFSTVIEVHDVLKTIYTVDESGDAYQQRIDFKPTISRYEISSDNALVAAVKDATSMPFDLSREPSIRLSSYTLDDKRFLLILIHHIGYDAWSRPILLNALSEAYSARLEKRQAKLDIPDIRYSDYAVWQRGYLQGEVLESLLTYWRVKLDGFETLDLAYDFPRPSKVSYQGDIVKFELSSSLSQALKRLCAENETTLFTVLLSGFYLVLSSLSGQRDIIVGSPSDNRHHAQTQSLLGFFVNSLALRQVVDGQSTVTKLIHQVHETVSHARVHQELPFEKLVDALSVERDVTRHPIYQVTFGTGGAETNHDHAWEPLFVNGGLDEDKYYIPAKVDLDLHVEENSNGLVGVFTYASSLFEQSSIQRMVDMYQRVLSAFVENQQQKVSHIDLLSAEERHCLQLKWNDTDRPYVNDKTLSQLFEAQVVATPNNIAIEFQGEQLSYSALNQRANELAHLIRHTVSEAQGKESNPDESNPDSLIALYMDRSLEMVVSILAVLKAGFAYLPISPDQPSSRAKHLLSDTKSSLVLTSETYLDLLSNLTSELSQTTTLINVDNLELVPGAPFNNPLIKNTSTDLAYVIYTSGTTGNPKGVMIEHRSVVNLCEFIIESNGLSSKTKALFNSNYIFDVSVVELFPCLFVGAHIVITPTSVLNNPADFSVFIRQNNVNRAFIATALLSSISSELASSGVETIHTGGERLAGLNCLPAPTTFNQYGPTEATVCITQNRITLDNVNAPEIGYAINNTRLYVLDDDKGLSPIGARGELYIGGASLARGYLNEKELTDERFVVNPYATDIDKRLGYTKLYRTGDCVRRLADGNLQFLGRKDNQIKLRGYRIELGEIESNLLKIEGVNQAFVITRGEFATKVLVAYVVADKGLDDRYIRDALADLLPDYMLPQSIALLDSIPLTLSGKLDIKSLPAINIVGEKSYVGPRNDLEAALCSIWQTVLELEEVGIHDNFFAIGGNSITAVKLGVETRKVLGADLPLSLLFEFKSIANIASKLDQKAVIKIANSNNDRPCLSFSQERLLFIERFEGGTDAYHIPLFYELDPTANLAALQIAFDTVIECHPILKTVYLNGEDGQTRPQTLESTAQISNVVVNGQIALTNALNYIVSKPFDLASEASIRLIRYELQDELLPELGTKSYLLILLHHIAFDEWSEQIFMESLQQAYTMALENRTVSLQSNEISYVDYAVWQRSYVKGENLDSLLSFWKKQLDGYQTLCLPTDKARPKQVDYRGQDHEFELSLNLSQQLKSLAQTQETTLYTVLLSAFYVTLSGLSGQKDILVGTPSDNRHHAQTQSLIGFFVNSLPLRVQLMEKESIASLIKSVHEVVTQAKVHQELPFEKLVDAIDVERDTSRHPIYQVMFTLAGGHKTAVSDTAGQTGTPSSLPLTSVAIDDSLIKYSPAKLDLSLFMDDREGALSGTFNYALSVFSDDRIKSMIEYYVRVLSAFAEDHQQSIDDIEVLSKKQRNIILEQWNNTDHAYSEAQSLAELFLEHVEKTPNKLALVCDQQSMTYRQLNGRANQLAHEIRARYHAQQGELLRPDTLIALYFNRGIDMVVSMLAVLKAGGAYVPMSPEYPTSRCQYILQDTKASLLLTQHCNISLLAPCLSDLDTPPQLISVDQLATGDVHESRFFESRFFESNDIELISGANDLAYVIYTSGTTGQPKGVMVEQRSVNNHLIGLIDRLGDVFGRVDFSTNYCFDLSVATNLCPILAGGTIFIYSGDVLDIDTYGRHLVNNRIDFIKSTPSLAELIKVQGHRVDTVLVGGERLTASCASRISAYARRIFNEYGPTEATVGSTVLELAANDEINIGRAFPNVKLYVLSASGQPVGKGVIGELFIGGAGVARGYLNNDGLSKEKFVANPFANDLDNSKGYTRLYKTGDLVQWLDDGKLQYIGRRDGQVKIRGYRVELSEIENSLSGQPAVNNSVVIVKEVDGRKFLAAYFVPEDGCQIDIDDVRRRLATRLPEYMVPMSYNLILAVPLTANGKLDVLALPEPELIDQRNYTAPESDEQSKLCRIWESALGLDKVGIDDNFFRIGGDSIVSIQLVVKLRQSGFNLQVKNIFDAPTIRQLAVLLNEINLVQEIKSEQGVLTGSFGLLPVQQLFFSKKYPSPHHWNQAFMVRLPGAIIISEIAEALSKLSEQHDMLRCRFQQSNQEIQQRYSPTHSLEFESTSIEGLTESQLRQRLSDWQSDFSFIDGPLWRAVHLTGYADGSARVFFALHHLIIDGVSWRIIAEDLRRLLMNESLPIKGTSYRQWVSALEAYSDTHVSEKQYWDSIVRDQRLVSETQDASVATISLSLEQTDCLLTQSNLGYHTEINDLLLSALALALTSTFDQLVNHITLEGHGREEIDETLDVSQTVGWFTTKFPIRLKSSKDIGDTIIQTKEMLRSVPNRGIGFGVFGQQDQLPLIGFNYLGRLDTRRANQHDVDWQIMNEDCGEMISAKNIDELSLRINGAIQSGRLTFDVSSRLAEQKSKVFLTAFKTALTDVIEQSRVAAAAGGIKTPSDFGVDSLSAERLTQLEATFGNGKSDDDYVGDDQINEIEV